MTLQKISTASLMLIGMMTLPIFADSHVGSIRSVDYFEGLYRPSGPDGETWSCNPQRLGQDRGALAVLDGHLEGLENRCELTDPRPGPMDASVTYKMTCKGEGMVSFGEVTLSLTASGLRLMREGRSFDWVRCPSMQTTDTPIPPPSNGKWIAGWGMGVAEAVTRDADGNEVLFSCQYGEHGALYVELGGQPLQSSTLVALDVDGQVFRMLVPIGDSSLVPDCLNCRDEFARLWEAVAAGSLLTIQTSQGEAAQFSLSGSRAAMGDEPCPQ